MVRVIVLLALLLDGAMLQFLAGCSKEAAPPPQPVYQPPPPPAPAPEPVPQPGPERG